VLLNLNERVEESRKATVLKGEEIESKHPRKKGKKFPLSNLKGNITITNIIIIITYFNVGFCKPVSSQRLSSHRLLGRPTSLRPAGW
jgi:hypothetical protein